MQSASLQLAILQLQSQTSEDLGRPPQKTTSEDFRRPPWGILRDHLGGPCKTTSEDLGIPPWKTTLEELGRPIRNTLEYLERPQKTLLTGNPLCLEVFKIKI